MIKMKKESLSLLALFLAMGMFAGCSSTEESSSSSGSSGTDTTNCAEQCALAPDHQQDECIMTCEAAN